MVPQPMSVGSGLQCQGPSPLPRPEQQGPPQALPIVGGTIHRRGGTPARRLQAKNHRQRGLHQCLEYRAATSLLPLNKRTFSLISFVIQLPDFSVTSDPSNGKGSDLTQGLI